MPVMSATKKRDEFPYLLIGCFGFLFFMYITFGEICYFTFGKNLTKPLIIEHMPKANIIIQIVKILFIVNLVFSYPLVIYITNVIFESYTFANMKKSSCRTWLKNVQRSFVLLFAILCAIYLKDKLDKLLALSGTILGSTVVMLVPVLCHFFLIAKTCCEKAVDIILAIIAVTILIVCTFQIIKTW